MMTSLKSPSGAFIAACALGLTLALGSCTQAKSEGSLEDVAKQTASAFQVNYVDAIGANALLMSQPDSVVIDIRTPKEIKAGHIEGAIFADFYDEKFEQELAKLDRDKPYIVHCRSGGRSTKALTTFKALGFTNITHMDGGMRGWNKANLPLTQP